MQQYSFGVFPKRADQPIMRFFGPDGRLIDERELDKADIDAFVAAVEGGYRKAGPDLASLGRRLYDWLDGPTQRWMERAREGHDRLTIRVDVDQRLRHLPWELLCADGMYLCSNPLRPFTPVRSVGKHASDAPQANRPLRILMMACSPLEVDPVLDFENEERLILDATQEHPVELVMEESGTLEGLSFRVSSREAGYYDVFHLSGHATVKNGQPIFLTETDVGELFEARADQIAGAFEGRWPRLVFLSGCKTGQAPEAGTLPSLCEAMVEAGAPAVLGWGLPVGDRDASIAVAELCRCLATGHRLDEAVARARQKLHEQESECWHLLRFYADATPLTELVTPLETADREKLQVRQAQAEFVDAGAKIEVCPRELFVGRRRLIQRCLRVLRSRPGTPHYREGVLLIGLGGLGKSSLAARLCERLPDHRRVVCVGNVDELAFMRALADQLEDAEAIKLLNTPDLSLENRLRQLLKSHLAKSPVLFVFDDFEHSVEDSQAGDAKVVKAAALQVLTAVLAAVRKTASDSCVLVTCRYDFALPGPARLHPEALESMRGADLRKKIDLLEHLKPGAATDPELKARATELASGNPRLLGWLDRVLADEQTDHDAVLSALEETAAEFREEVLLLELLGQLEEDGRRLVAMVSVCDLPVDRAAVEVIAGDVPVDPHLGRASALGLIEAGLEPGTIEQRYYVSGILDPMLATVLSEDERTEARRRAARHLHKVWWVDAAGMALEQGLEIHRLAMVAQEKEIAAEVGDAIATVWFDQARYREAEALCGVTLQLGDDHRVLHSLARAEQVLGRADDARQHFEQALAFCPAASPTAEKAVLEERSAIVHNFAGLVLQQGEVDEAMGLWEESLKLDEQIGSVRGKAATLHAMAGVLAQRGDVDRAMGLWEESLKLKE